MTGGLGALGLESARALLEHGLAKLALFDAVEPNEKLDDLRRDFPDATIQHRKLDITNERQSFRRFVV